MNSNWTAKDAIRASLGFGFNTFPGLFNLRILHVEDSGDPYFAGLKKFVGWDILLKELTEVDEDGLVSFRVSIGDPTADLYNRAGAHTEQWLQGEDMSGLFLRCIGKGTDGKPVMRLGADTAALITALTP